MELFPFKPKKSTQNAVVKEVNALSALENAAARRPRKNTMGSMAGKDGCMAIEEKSVSPEAVILLAVANSLRKTPSDKNKRFTTSKLKPNKTMFFWAFFNVLTVRFFCIISWSRPVMAMAMAAPPSN